MLTDQSFESFRVYSLDTIARLDEAISIAVDVQLDRLPKQSLEPVQAELAWSLSKDPIAKDIVNAEIELFANLIKGNHATTNEITQHVAFIRKRLGQKYKTLCEEKILTLFSDEKKRVELRRTTGFYCSHLVNAGYSKSYLLRCVETTFFATPMRRAGERTLREFFRTFDNESKTFLVYTAVDAEFGKFLSELGFQVYLSAARIPKKLNHGVTRHMPITPAQAYIISRRLANDEDSAIAQCEGFLASARALAFIAPHNMKCAWEQDMYVVRSRSTQGTILRGQALPLQRAIVRGNAAKRAIKSLVSFSNKVLTNFDEASTERILNSLNTSALARTSTSIENQLISLWSAVEVLLSEPPHDTTRIHHYAKLLLPCICLRYIRRQTVAVFEEMQINYQKNSLPLLARSQILPRVTSTQSLPLSYFCKTTRL